MLMVSGVSRPPEFSVHDIGLAFACDESLLQVTCIVLGLKPAFCQLWIETWLVVTKSPLVFLYLPLFWGYKSTRCRLKAGRLPFSRFLGAGKVCPNRSLIVLWAGSSHCGLCLAVALATPQYLTSKTQWEKTNC